MEFISHEGCDPNAIEALFREAFALNEGEEEGALIGHLAREMMNTEADDLYGFVAREGATLLGAIFFSRMHFGDDVEVFILSPVAVAPSHHGEGVGQALIRHGIDELKSAGVEYLITYGDPNFYSRVGFEPITQEEFPPPYPLGQPHGWIGQSLADAPIHSLTGPSHCVPALSDPGYW